MRQKQMMPASSAEEAIKDIRRATRRHWSAEDKIRIVLEGLRGEESISELCRREGIAASQYYGLSKEFMEAGKRRLAGDTTALAKRDGVLDIRPQKNGPLAISGSIEMISGTGRSFAKARSAMLCRCGHSTRKPFCDGTHARIGFIAP
jgi:transposase